jgi:hypothetical protein
MDLMEDPTITMNGSQWRRGRESAFLAIFDLWMKIDEYLGHDRRRTGPAGGFVRIANHR